MNAVLLTAVCTISTLAYIISASTPATAVPGDSYVSPVPRPSTFEPERDPDEILLPGRKGGRHSPRKLKKLKQCKRAYKLSKDRLATALAENNIWEARCKMNYHREVQRLAAEIEALEKHLADSLKIYNAYLNTGEESYCTNTL